jgi:uncharacterized protein (DUF697 family)
MNDNVGTDGEKPMEESEAMVEATLEERVDAANIKVREYSMGAMAVGLVPIPLLDLAALFTVQLKMLHSLANIFDIEFKGDVGRSALGSLVGGVIPVASAPTVAASLGKFIPGFGQAIAAGSQVVLNGAVTYAVGKVFLQHFASGGTFLTFDPEAVKEYFEEQLEEGKKVAAELRKKEGQ